MQDFSIQNVNPSRKSEISLTVDHAGPLVLLKLWVIEFALNHHKLSKPEYQLKIYLPAVLPVDQDAMVDIQKWPGNTLLELVLSLVIYMVMILGANHTPYLHAIIILLVNTNHAVIPSQLHLVLDNVIPNTQRPILKIFIRELLPTQLELALKPSRLKS